MQTNLQALWLQAGLWKNFIYHTKGMLDIEKQDIRKKKWREMGLLTNI